MIVIYRQVKLVACSDIVVKQLTFTFNDTKLFLRLVLLEVVFRVTEEARHSLILLLLSTYVRVFNFSFIINNSSLSSNAL
jgi:hypothetical protein